MKRKSLCTPLRCLLLAAFIVGLYLLQRVFLPKEGDARLIQGAMAVALALCGAFSLWARKKPAQVQMEALCLALVCAGIVMRTGYMLYTGCDVRSHDLGGFTEESGGHAAYLLTLMRTGRLPQSGAYQFYQQPFFYILGSLVSLGVNGILGCTEPYALVDATKLVSCYASCVSLLLADKLCSLARLNGKGKAVALALIAFTPASYLTGGRVNSDALAAMFMLLTAIRTILWVRSSTWKNTCALAVLYGFAVMTKISCAVPALLTFALFLYKLYKAEDHLTARQLLGKVSVFGFISLPLGLWFGARKAILFGQPLNYVPYISHENDLYIGEHSVFTRIFRIDIGNLLATPYANPHTDISLPVYTVKTALFGEFTFKVPVWAPTLLLISACVLAIFLVIAFVRQLSQARNDKTCLYLGALVIALYLSMLLFVQQYPFGCSMDFRYIPFIVVPLGVLFGKFFECGKYPRASRCSAIALGCYSALSCLTYLLV